MKTKILLNASLRKVPPFATAHTFCASRDDKGKSGFYWRCLLKLSYFCAVYNYAEKVELGQDYWNPKIKLRETVHFLEIIKLQFGKHMP